PSRAIVPAPPRGSILRAAVGQAAAVGGARLRGWAQGIGVVGLQKAHPGDSERTEVHFSIYPQSPAMRKLANALRVNSLWLTSPGATMKCMTVSPALGRSRRAGAAAFFAQGFTFISLTTRLPQLMGRVGVH